MEALGALIDKHDPDMVALQEMTPLICKLLFSQAWVSLYFINVDKKGQKVFYFGPQRR